MKNLIFIIFFGLIITACDPPRDRRAAHEASRPDQNSFLDDLGGDKDFDQIDRSDENHGDDGQYIIDDKESGESSSGQIPSEVSHCQWPAITGGSYASEHSHIGQYTVCQSTSQDTDIYIQLRHPISDSTLCLVPTYESNGKAIFIGEPRCLEIGDSQTIYKIGLLKNRQGYSNFNVTGVMMMRDKAYFYPAPFNQYLLSPDAYLFCAQWLDMYGDPSYCQAYDAVGQYIYHKF